jgi:hypothetical protein
VGNFLLFLALTANAAELQNEMTWELKIGGKVAGHRDLTVKYEPVEDGMRRILEVWTDVDGNAGPIGIVFRQRMTAHTANRTPASFHSVTEANGLPGEVQARWTPSAWWVTTTLQGRTRTVDMPVDRIDLSTADLMDPATSFSLARYAQVRMLSAETGEVYVGDVSDLGSKEIKVGEQKVRVQGYRWSAPIGKSDFWYNGDGFLVDYTMHIAGIAVEGRLTKPPPPGVDDFPVAVGGPKIEVIQL